MHKAVQWFTDNEIDQYIKAIGKLLDINENRKINKNEETYNMHINRNGKISVQLNRSNNIKIYDKIIKQLYLPIYLGIKSIVNYRECLVSKRSQFSEISVFSQINVLNEITKFMRCKGLQSNLSEIGLASNAGRLFISNNITDADVVLINSSPCGLHVVKRKL